MTNKKELDKLSPQDHGDDFRQGVLNKPLRFRFLSKLAYPLVFIAVVALLIAGIRYGGYAYQASLKHQVEIIQAQNQPLLEFAKRVNQ